MKTKLQQLLEMATEKLKESRKLGNSVEQIVRNRKIYDELIEFAEKNNLSEYDVEKAWTAATNHIK